MNITINNFFCLQNIELDINSKETYILGEQGSGKTKLLHAIALALRDCVPFGITYYAAPYYAEMLESGAFSGSTDYGEPLHIIGFGQNRQMVSSDFYTLGVQSILTKDSVIDSPVGVLSYYENQVYRYPSNLDLTELAKVRYEELKSVVESITGISDMRRQGFDETIRCINLDAKGYKELDGAGEFFYFSDGSAPIRFKEMPSGLRSLLMLVTNLFILIDKCRADNRQMIVFIDEIEQHLHPTEQMVFMQKLRKYFPEVYFIVTTNSPVTVMGASKDAVFCKLHKKDGRTRLIGSVPQSDIRKMMSNQLITSPLFGLDTAGVTGFNAVNASNSDYTYQQIHEAIRKRLDSEPTLDSEEVQRWIAEEMDKIKPL